MSDGGATITVRVIRSFEHRNIRPLVLHGVQLATTTARQLQERLVSELSTRPGLLPVLRNYAYDTMKITHKAHGSKGNDLVINTDDPQLNLDPDLSLAANGVEHETEISYFRADDYERYKESLRATDRI